MKAVSWVRSRPKAFASAAAVTAGAVTLTILAVTYDGNPTAEVDLHDGGVWITNTSSLMVGHFNYQSTVLDGAVRTTGESFDITQNGGTVLVVDGNESTASLVDPARVALAESTSIPIGAKVAHGGNTVAILDRSSGELWVSRASELPTFELENPEPVAELGAGADVTVGVDGTVHAVSAEQSAIVSVALAGDGEPEEPRSQPLGELAEDAQPTITAVGSVPVVLDDIASVVHADGRRIELAAEDLVLQQPSAAADAVSLASASHLVQLPLGGGEPVEISSGGEGAPAAPVQLLGCTYAAWGSSGKFVRDCASDENDLTADIPGFEGAATLVFRTNRDVVILNDVAMGAAWLVSESLQRVDNWSDITPPEGEDEETEQTTEEVIETTLPDRTEENTPPVAEDDAFGVRPGGTTLLPVLDNDNDIDGDVLVASLEGDQPSIGEVKPVYDGGSLQIEVPHDMTGTATFTYRIDDGRPGGTDTAQVRVTVVPPETNRPPQSKRTTNLVVESGGTVSYNVLPDWIDPDGDDIYLHNVVAAPGDEVDFTTDGQITYRAVASLQGRKQVEISVADSSGQLASGTITLDVRPAGSTSPTTNADMVVTRVNEQVTVSPLLNDTSSGREPLRLASVDLEGTADVDIQRDDANNNFTFSAPRAGTYYVKYLVTAGPNGVPGIVRIDVREESEEDVPPIAVRDVALLPAGGEVLVGVLNNDSDPAGGVLVVQSVSVDPDSRISVSVLGHEMLRIGDQGGLTTEARIRYRISNGSHTAEADVIVIPIPAPDKLMPPVASDDTAVVRVGDVVTIPVLANDTHPNGDALHLVPELLPPLIDPEDGEAFVSEDELRFRAGDVPKTVYATYEVVDSQGQKDAAYVTIQILPLDEERNDAPQPRDLIARAVAGTSINIAVPLDGIDTDGDSVELLGLESSPRKGRVSEVAQNYLVYEAFTGSSGVDTFRYRVRDRLGAEGIATIRVGIAPGEQVNQAPYAVKDSVVVRPGREVAVPVLANDSDPEGDKIRLVTDGLTVPDVEGLSARVSGDRVLIQTPDREIETSVQYTISDTAGATATAAVQVTVAEDVPLLAPIARDDRVLVTEIDETLVVDVDVLANDEDPDGITEALLLEVESGAEVLPDRKLRVTVGEDRQLIRYTVTDQDDLSASAFVFVPALEELRPVLTSTEPVMVDSGETIELPLSDYVTVAGGSDVIITEHSKVRAIHSNGADLVRDQRTLVYTSADRYHGQDALTFEVTDGTGPDDPAGRTATLTIPITVLPPENEQPTFTSAEMTVAPGEDPTALDLAALTEDPDVDDTHSYQLVGSLGDGLTASIDGATLSVEATASTPKGTTATVSLRVTDGETAPVDGQVRVRVTASTRPLPTASDDTVNEVHQGETVTVSVLSNDVNPFPETPLRIVGANVETGRGEADVQGDQVLVTPAPDFVGSMVVRYTIQDATDDSDRQVDGRILLTVQGVPDAPGTPTVASVQDRTVVLSWSPGSNNGAEITHYTVQSVLGGSYSRRCDSTTCTLDGLTNNVEYTFEVIAHNRVGPSPASSPSEVARPDARPDTPLPPTLEFGDRSLSVSWETPTTPGSPVEHYTLEISPAPPSGPTRKTQLVGNETVWEGLENGTTYQVRVQAHNRAPDPSSWSRWSNGEIPAGPPAAAAAPITTELSPVGSQAQMGVNWVAPHSNGDAVSAYQLEVRQGDTVVQTISVAAGRRSQAVTVPTSETNYTYRVRAENKAGWGEWSPLSLERRAIIAPGAPTDVSATAGDNELTVSFTPGPRNGAREGEVTYQYSLNGGGWSTLPAGNRISSGVSNNNSYTVRVRAVANTDGSTYVGAESAASNSVAPSGPPRKPALSGSVNDTTINWSWNAPARNGSDMRMRSRVGNGSWSGWSSWGASSGSRSSSHGHSANVTLTVQVQDREGRTNSEQLTRTTAPPPQPRVWVTQGDAAGSCVNGCRRFVVHFENLDIGARDVRCYSSNYPGGVSDYTYRINFNGSGRQQISCYTGRDGQDVWVDILGWGSSVDTEKTHWPRP